jgi:hypothetical protein
MAGLSLSTAERIVAASQAADAARDADAFVALLKPDVVFRLGSSPVIHGRDAVRAAVRESDGPTGQYLIHIDIAPRFAGRT